MTYTDIPFPSGDEDIDLLQREAVAEVRKVRSVALRRLLFLWFQYHGFLADWTRDHLKDEAKGFLSPDGIQDLWGCSRRSAYDYAHAVKGLKKIDELSTATWNKFMKELIEMRSQTSQKDEAQPLAAKG